MVGDHDRKSAVKSLIGISATELDEKYRKLNQEKFIRSLFYQGGTRKRPIYFIKNPTTGQYFQAGYFEEVPLAELVPQASTSSKAEAVTKLRFHLLADNYDIGLLQANPFFNGAVFQVASNFSTLEPSDKNAGPEDCTLDDYENDKTQGPKASLSALPGLFLRMYGVFRQQGPPYSNSVKSFYGAKSPLNWRQANDRQVELLSETGIPVQNGYIALYGVDSKGNWEFKDEHTEFLEKIKEKKSVEDFSDIVLPMKIGIHRDIQVLFGNQSDGSMHTPLNRNNQIIHQVFIAALDRGQTNKLFWLKNLNLLEKYSWVAPYRDSVDLLAQAILGAGYKGTLGAAHRLGAKKVVLTQVGGGVFDNKHEWIRSALLGALKKYEHLDIDVYLNVYDSNGISAAQKIAQQYIAEAQKENISAAITTLDALKLPVTTQPTAQSNSWWSRFRRVIKV